MPSDLGLCELVSLEVGDPPDPGVPPKDLDTYVVAPFLGACFST